MVSSNPLGSRTSRRVRVLTHHPARSIALVLMLLAACVGYAAYQHQSQPQPQPTAHAQQQSDQTPAVHKEVDHCAQTLDQLAHEAAAAQTQLDESTTRLAALQAHAESAGDTGNLEQAASHATHQLEQATAARQAIRELLQRLQTARQDPAQLAAAVAPLLESLPALRRLHAALTAAESTTSQMLLTMLPDHPRVQAGRGEEQTIRTQLQQALDVAIQDAQAAQMRLDAQVDTLSQQFADLQERQQRLAAVQSDHDHQLALVQQQTGRLKQAQDRLQNAQRNAVAVENTMSSQPVDQPAVLPPAKEPGRLLLVAAAIVGGLFVSLGLYTLRGSPVRATSVPLESISPVATARTQPTPTPAPQKTTRMTLTQALKRCAGD